MISNIARKSSARLFLFLITSSFASAILAGTPDGPYVIFADLSGASDTPAIIKSYMDSDRKGLFCGDVARSPLVLLKKRPEGMDDQHLRDALIKKDLRERKKLQDLFVAYRLDTLITQGLDGAVVFVNQPKPRMLSLGVAGAIKSVPIRSSRPEAVIEAFCDALPDIHRN